MSENGYASNADEFACNSYVSYSTETLTKNSAGVRMNKTGMYVAVFGLMAIFTASLLLTTAYSSTKNNLSINFGDNIIKVKKAWQNFYITADRISSDEFGKIVTDICPAGNGKPTEKIR